MQMWGSLKANVSNPTILPFSDISFGNAHPSLARLMGLQPHICIFPEHASSFTHKSSNTSEPKSKAPLPHRPEWAPTCLLTSCLGWPHYLLSKKGLWRTRGSINPSTRTTDKNSNTPEQVGKHGHLTHRLSLLFNTISLSHRFRAFKERISTFW